MSRVPLATTITLIAVGFATAALAQRPQIETTKVEGTDNVYIFRNGRVVDIRFSVSTHLVVLAFLAGAR